MLNILTDPKIGSISSPQYGYRYLSKRKEKSYLLHMMDADILVKGKKVISSPHDGCRYFRKVCHFLYLSNYKVMCQCDLH